MIEKNPEIGRILDIARSVYAACDSRSMDEFGKIVDEYFAPDFVGHGPHPGITPDAAGTKGWNAALYKAFPDFNVTVGDIFAQGDKVVTRWTVRGTHKGEFQGIAPSGKQASVSGITISRYEDGKIVESWFEWDTLDAMKQLGISPSDEDKHEVLEGITINITINKA